MTQEEKQLLFKDLCARLPYGVKADGYPWITREYVESISRDRVNLQGTWVNIEDVKPYLRPLSSMTTEEEYEYHQCKNINYLDICEMEHEEILETTALCFSRATDWLNKKGFDYRGLIPMGLAIEAKEGMYK